MAHVSVLAQYPEMKKTMGEFTLEIKSGEFTDSEIMVMLGENGEFSCLMSITSKGGFHTNLHF